MNMPRTEQDKPFAIPKLLVWEAWRQVKVSKTGFHGDWVCRFLLLASQLVLTP
jgi:hypothetical protein